MKQLDTRDFIDKLFDNSLDAIIFTDETGYVTEANKSFMELTGYTKEEIIGKHMSEFSPMKEGTYECTTGELIQIEKKFSDYIKSSMGAFLENGKLHNAMGFQLRKDGKVVPVEDNMVFLLDDKGERTRAFAVIRDITERKKAEKALNQANDFLGNIFKTSVDGIIIGDSEGKIEMVNEGIEQMLGCSRDKLVGKHTSELEFQGRTHKVSGKELITTLLSEGTVSGVERTWLRSDGSSIDIEMNIALLKDSNGDLTGSVASIRDITVRKQAEKELAETKDYLENIIESSLDGIVVSDGMGYISKANKAFLKMLGYREEEVIGKHIIECSPLEEGNYNTNTGELIQLNDAFFESLKTSMESFLHDGKVINRRTFYLTKDNKLLPTEDSLVFLFNSKGDRIGALGIIRDITERRQAEESLRKSEEKYHNLIDHANDAIVSINRKGMIIGFNKMAEKLFGYSHEEMLEKPAYLLVAHHHREKQKSVLKEFAETGTSSYLENKITEGTGLRKDGKEFSLEISYYILDFHGELIATAIIRDITERKEVEQKIIDYQKQLKSLTSKITVTEEQERRRFAEFLHDEIGQQLFATHLQLELLKGSLSSAKDTETLDKAINNIKNVMSNSRSLTFELSSPILHELGFEKALEWLAEHAHEKYDIMVTFKDDQREKPLDDDVKTFLYQAVRELFINIAKHAQTKNASLSIKKDNSNIRICVKDNGVGFAHPTKHSPDAKIEGFGLFRITERLEQLGGQLEIESQPNHGTNITLVVPVSNSSEDV